MVGTAHHDLLQLVWVVDTNSLAVTGGDETEDSANSGISVVENLPEGQPWYTRMIASVTEAGKQ